MSSLPSPYYYPGHSAAVPHQRAPQSAGASNGHTRSNHDYTLVHHGRQVRIGPVAFWIVVGTLVIMAIWSVATGTYFAFKDDVLTRLVGRQAELQFAYEDRIAELRSQVDRIASRQLLDQEQVEQKLEALLRRQAVLEQRTGKLGAGLGAALSAATGTDSEVTGSVPRSNTPMKPSPMSGDGSYAIPTDRELHALSRGDDRAIRSALKPSGGGIEGALARAAVSMDRVEHRQLAALTSVEEKFDQKARNMRGVLADLGVDPAKSQGTGEGIGGPFIPVKPPRANADAFDRQIYRVALARAQADRYSRVLNTVPVKKPVPGDIDVSSPFGMRMDPFVRGPAIHSGLDIRGDTGEPVRATAAGKVETAGWNGGYGKMVEIDHGNQFSTRYGHLSEITVKLGQTVRAGDIIGRIGSTGRSTGPHLHYETRINDEAVNPQKFLRAGARLGAN